MKDLQQVNKNLKVYRKAPHIGELFLYIHSKANKGISLICDKWYIRFRLDSSIKL